MRYCVRCVQPDTRPGLVFSNEGVCGACFWEDEKKNINWADREKELQDIAEEAKSAAKGPYNCIVGVSGGKDSTFQALYARDRLGLRPLLVNCEPDGISEIGRYNIENLKQLGFDVISVRPNPLILRKLVRRNFFSCLNPGGLTEYPLWASSYIMAIKFDIPLVIQGENPGQTLGIRDLTGAGSDALSILKHNTISADPLKTFISDDITRDDLFMYTFNPEELFERNIKAVWLSYYAKEWSQPHNARFSMGHGLKIRPETVNPYGLGTYRRYSQMDAGGGLLEVNQLLKYIKFGFGQTTDAAGYDIREGLISREEGIFLVRELDGRCAPELVASMCRYIEITEEEFWKHAESCRGDMWRQDKQGQWRLTEPIWEQVPIQGKHDVRAIMNRLGM